MRMHAQVPTLTDGDIVVCESLAAIIYLEETYSAQGTPLLPPLAQAAARALVRLSPLEQATRRRHAAHKTHLCCLRAVKR